MLFAEGATDPASWGQFFGSLGPMGILLIPLMFAVLVIALVMGAGTVALTGIRRWGIPGLAWTIGGLRQELHGLRQDLRAYSTGEDMAPLDPLDQHRSLFPPRAGKAPISEPPVPAAPPLEPASRRQGPRSRAHSRPQ